MRRFIKYLTGFAVALLIFTVAGFFILPPVIKSVLVDKLSQIIQRPVSIQEIKINPYRLTVTIGGLEIKEKSGTDKFMSFDELYVNLEASSIIRRSLVITEIKLTKPYVRIIRNSDLSYNFSDLLKQTKSEKEPKKETGDFLFSLNNIRIEQGSLDFWDVPNHTKHTVRDLLIAVPFLTNTSDRIEHYTQPVVSANINGDPYLIRGRTKPFSDTLETVFDIEFKDLDIPYYLAYIPVDLNFKLLKGKLDTKLNLAFSRSRDKKSSVKIAGDVALKQFAVDDKTGQPVIRIPELNIAMASIEPLEKVFHFSKIALVSPEVTVRRGKQGELNLLTISLSAEDKKQAEKRPEEKKTESPSPVLVSADEFQIKAGKISFKDEQPSQPVALALNRLNLAVRNLTTAKNGKSDLSLSVVLNEKGSISAVGPLVVNPLAANFMLKVDNIDIRSFQSYFTDKVKINVTGGQITTSGNVTVKDQGDKGLSAGYNGKLLIVDFSSIDKKTANDFLKWKSLYFDDVHVGYNPLSVDVRQIVLANFFVRLIVNEDGTLNLQNIFEDQTSKEMKPPAASEIPPSEKVREKANASAREPAKVIKIGTVTLQDGTVSFRDRLITPNYLANLSEIGGRISGLSSIDENPAEVELRGKFERHMPLEITGKIQPFKKDLFVDLKASFKDMDLSPVSPYSGKYIGYTIQKGKLSFDLKYLIVNKKLDSQNKVFIDQLTLGDKVESPQATKLPVSLAIALLKDMKGEITLDIPVSGRIDDPKFKVFPVIIKVLVNLITKAVTAPFALIGNLFGGGEELSYVEFDYGRANITGQDMKKIESLIKALHERPSLSLDIEGHADLEKDREGLKNLSIERKVKARKLNEMIRKGLPAVSIDEVKIDPQEYEKYLREAYKAEPFPKSRDAIGLIKKLPVDEMVKLMLTYSSVREDDLKLLASRRAKVVRDLLLKSGQIQPERIFIVEPKTLAPEKKEKQKSSRVDFRLK